MVGLLHEPTIRVRPDKYVFTYRGRAWLLLELKRFIPATRARI